MLIKYLYYDNTTGDITGYDIATNVKPDGDYLEDQTVDDDFDIDYYEVVDVSGTMTLQERSQAEKDQVDADRVTETNRSDRLTETEALLYDFFKLLKEGWSGLDSGLTTALADWKTAIDQIWTDHPE